MAKDTGGGERGDPAGRPVRSGFVTERDGRRGLNSAVSSRAGG